MCRRRAVVAVAATWLLWGCGGKTDSTPDEGTGIADSGDLSFADPDGGDASGDGSADACKPSCDGLQCGDDGCGGTCGACSGAQDQCLAGP
ncbi:MAG: hypothetical protein FJ109_21790, partial [Deltaproteobacteria bacterium]|nr:hypothetical protein [Deltaproteobacteria bacterium]